MQGDVRGEYLELTPVPLHGHQMLLKYRWGLYFTIKRRGGRCWGRLEYKNANDFSIVLQLHFMFPFLLCFLVTASSKRFQKGQLCPFWVSKTNPFLCAQSPISSLSILISLFISTHYSKNLPQKPKKAEIEKGWNITQNVCICTIKSWSDW